MKNLLNLAILISFIAFYACGSSFSFNVVDATKNAAPSFQSASASSVKINTTDWSYNHVKGMFTYCGDSSSDYQDENATTCGTANGVDINISNIYKLLFQTQDYLDDYATDCVTTVSATQKVTIKYDSGSVFIESDPGDMECVNNVTEDASKKRYKAAAWKTSTDTVSFGVLYDHQDASDEALTYGDYNSTTHELNLILALYSEKDKEGSYLYLKGNTSDHSFTFHDGQCFDHGKSTRFSDDITISTVSEDYIYVTCDNDNDGQLESSVNDKEYCLKASDGSTVSMNTQCQAYKDYLDTNDGSPAGLDGTISTPWEHDSDGDGKVDNYTPTEHFSHIMTVS